MIFGYTKWVWNTVLWSQILFLKINLCIFSIFLLLLWLLLCCSCSWSTEYKSRIEQEGCFSQVFDRIHRKRICKPGRNGANVCHMGRYEVISWVLIKLWPWHCEDGGVHWTPSTGWCSDRYSLTKGTLITAENRLFYIFHLIFTFRTTKYSNSNKSPASKQNFKFRRAH